MQFFFSKVGVHSIRLENENESALKKNVTCECDVFTNTMESHKWGILEWKNNYACVIYGPLECNQGIV